MGSLGVLFVHNNVRREEGSQEYGVFYSFSLTLCSFNNIVLLYILFSLFLSSESVAEEIFFIINENFTFRCRGIREKERRHLVQGDTEEMERRDLWVRNERRKWIEMLRRRMKGKNVIETRRDGKVGG